MTALRRIADRIAYLFELLAEAALVVLLLLVAHEVFVRYLLNAPTQFSVEFSEYLLVLISFSAAAYVLRQDRHVRVTFALDLMPPRVRAAAELLSYLLLLAYCVVLVIYGGDMSWTALLGNDRSSSLINFPLWIPYAFIPLGGLVLSLQCVVKAADALVLLRGETPTPKRER